jgi:hypothetical protein
MGAIPSHISKLLMTLYFKNNAHKTRAGNARSGESSSKDRHFDQSLLPAYRFPGFRNHLPLVSYLPSTFLKGQVLLVWHLPVRISNPSAPKGLSFTTTGSRSFRSFEKSCVTSQAEPFPQASAAL